MARLVKARIEQTPKKNTTPSSGDKTPGIARHKNQVEAWVESTYGHAKESWDHFIQDWNTGVKARYTQQEKLKEETANSRLSKRGISWRKEHRDKLKPKGRSGGGGAGDTLLDYAKSTTPNDSHVRREQFERLFWQTIGGAVDVQNKSKSRERYAELFERQFGSTGSLEDAAEKERDDARNRGGIVDVVPAPSGDLGTVLETLLEGLPRQFGYGRPPQRRPYTPIDRLFGTPPVDKIKEDHRVEQSTCEQLEELLGVPVCEGFSFRIRGRT